jgi:hypothetical protein
VTDLTPIAHRSHVGARSCHRGVVPGNEPWMPPQPIAPSGRVAAWAVAACFVGAGIAAIVLAWNELTCATVVDPGGDRIAPASVCEVLTGIGGVAAVLGGLSIAVGAVIVFRVARRPLIPTGADGWRWVLGVMFAIGATVLVTRFPNQTCPDGIHLSAPFGLCIDTEAGRRFDATSWIGLKMLAVLAAWLVGLGLVPRRRLTPVAVPLTLLAWGAGVGWLLLDTIGREHL